MPDVDVFQGDASDTRERVIWVIKLHAGHPARYKALEDRFGIPARRWQNVCNRVQQPSLEMLSALSLEYPYFTDWMLSGTSRTVLQVDPTDPDWRLKASSWITPKDSDLASSFPERVIKTARVLWGATPKEMAQSSGIEAAVWEKLLSGKQAPTTDMVLALAKAGPKYLLWTLNGSADTYLQLSPADVWQDKLARALGGDLDNKPSQWQSKVARVLGGKTAKSK